MTLYNSKHDSPSSAEKLKKIFSRQRSRKLPQDMQQVALRKLRMLNRAVTLNDLRVPPANHLEKLRGDRVGQYSGGGDFTSKRRRRGEQFFSASDVSQRARGHANHALEATWLSCAISTPPRAFGGRCGEGACPHSPSASTPSLGCIDK